MPCIRAGLADVSGEDGPRRRSCGQGEKLTLPLEKKIEVRKLAHGPLIADNAEDTLRTLSS